MIQQPVYAFDAAFRRIMTRLQKQGFRINNVLPINQHRYIIVKGEQDDNPKNILIYFKRDVFFNFGIQFKQKGEKGVGDTINSEDIKKAIMHNVEDIYSVFPNGIAYTIKLNDFMEHSHRWTNKEGKNVRSINIHHFKRFDLI